MAENYTRGAVLGKGTFAIVYRATDKDGRVVALKELFPDDKDGKKGIHPTALREIKLLKELRHDNIIGLLDTYQSKKKKSVVLVMEYMQHDLEAVIKDTNIVLSEADVKSFLQQLLRALAACHGAWVLHRDVKPNNCLISADGSLKLADFGLSRVYGSPGGHLTPQVFAQWYRPPELFFGARQYNASIDVWAAGCIFGELLLRRPLFDGVCDIDVLAKVFALLGTPNDTNWPSARSLPFYLQFTETQPAPLAKAFPSASPGAVRLLSRMLCLDPSKRISAQEALDDPYFTTSPLPTPPERLPRPVKHHGPHPGEPARPPPGRGAPDVSPGDERPAKRRAGASSAELARASPRTQH